MTRLEPEWIINNQGELGVKIGDRFFFLYKEGSIEYKKEDMEEGETMQYRPVLKREFGEVCIPQKYVAEGYCCIPGHVDFVAETDGWKELPLK